MPPSRVRLPVPLLGAGLVASALAVLDPRLASLRWPAMLAASVAIFFAARKGERSRGLVLAFLLTLAFGLAAGVRPGFGADSISYYSYLRSLFFDRDLDFTNEWAAWGHEPAPLTATGLRQNHQSVGPAFVWAPFFLAAHGLVLLEGALGLGRYAADGYSAPYLRATSLGTLTSVVLGALLLVQVISKRHGERVAVLAVLGAVLASPIAYYAFLAPAMAHGAAFGAACVCLWAIDGVHERQSLRGWVMVGVALGLCSLMRWQGLVLGLLVLPPLVHGLKQGSLPVAWPATGALVALGAFSPQLFVWRTLYGRFLTVPQGSGFLDWSSPHFADVLFSANHGLFTWTPAMLIGALGMLFGVRACPLFHAGGLAVLFATAWVNGGVRDWAGSDAFGARRFDVVVPLLAFGIAAFSRGLVGLMRRRPVLVPVGLLLFTTAWNLGLVHHHGARLYPDAAPLERLAGDQAHLLRVSLEALLERMAGTRGRSFAYRYLSGEYLYTSFNPSGSISLGRVDEREIKGGWSPRQRPPDGPAFRWALRDESCVRIPLEAAFELSLAITARAPRRLEPQEMRVGFNDHAAGAVLLGSEWREYSFPVPIRYQTSGENWACLSFSNRPPEEDARAAIAELRIY